MAGEVLAAADPSSVPIAAAANVARGQTRAEDHSIDTNTVTQDEADLLLHIASASG